MLCGDPTEPCPDVILRLDPTNSKQPIDNSLDCFELCRLYTLIMSIRAGEAPSAEDDCGNEIKLINQIIPDT